MAFVETGQYQRYPGFSTSNHRTEVYINVYDLLSPGAISSALWLIGTSLLHTGVEIQSLNLEYAFGGHSAPGVSGVYSTKPNTLPSGAFFRSRVFQGVAFRSDREIARIIREVSTHFSGPSYNLLTNNCNHFSSYLCQQLTNTPAPSWMNRAARIGTWLPCLVPSEWKIAPPNHDSTEGALLQQDEDERTAMLSSVQSPRPPDLPTRFGVVDQTTQNKSRSGEAPKQSHLRDADGRKIPPSERAPLPTTQ